MQIMGRFKRPAIQEQEAERQVEAGPCASLVAARFTSPEGDDFNSLEAALNHVRVSVGGKVGINGEELYLVHSVLAQRVCRNKRQVLVHWKGWRREQATWEPVENVPPHFVDKFQNGDGRDGDCPAHAMCMDIQDEPADAMKLESEIKDSVTRATDDGTAHLESVWKRLALYANVGRISPSDWEALKDVLVIPHLWCRVCAGTRSNGWKVVSDHDVAHSRRCLLPHALFHTNAGQ